MAGALIEHESQTEEWPLSSILSNLPCSSAAVAEPAPAQRTAVPDPEAALAGRARDRLSWGHEDQFPPCQLNARCVFREETFAEARANGRDVP